MVLNYGAIFCMHNAKNNCTNWIALKGKKEKNYIRLSVDSFVAEYMWSHRFQWTVNVLE